MKVLYSRRLSTVFWQNDGVTHHCAAGAAFIDKDSVAIRMFKSVFGYR